MNASVLTMLRNNEAKYKVPQCETPSSIWENV